MKTKTATAAKTNFSSLLRLVLKELIIIKRDHCNIAVMMSCEEYERLSAIEDHYWLLQANQAEQQGYLGNQKSEELLRALLSSQD